MANFNFTFDPGTSLQQMIGVEIAGRVWSQYLTDNISVNIHVGVSSSLPTSVIGGALPAMSSGVSFSNVRNAMTNDRRSSDDYTAVSHLSAGDTQTVNFDWMNNGFQAVSQQVSTQRSLNKLNLTNANAKALGLNDNGASLDGYILLGNNVPWSYDFTRSSAMSSTRLDFLSTAMHEIGHVLGFISGVDDPGWKMDVWDAYYTGQMNSTYTNTINDRSQNATSLDLFRFNYNKSSPYADLSYGHEGGRKGLSIDDGRTFIGQFSTGATAAGGNWEQASHWWNGMNAIMAPTLGLGSRMDIAQIDLRAMDVMGWDLSSMGINTSYNLSTLQSQAKQALASRLGTSVSWLDNNQSTAASWLGQNRTADIDQMIDRSKIYEWGTDGDGWWQRVTGLFQQRGLFSSLTDQDMGILDQLSQAESVTPTNTYITFAGSESTADLTSDRWTSNVTQSPLNTQLSLDSPSAINLEVESSITTVLTQNWQFDLSTPKSWSFVFNQTRLNQTNQTTDQKLSRQIWGDDEHDQNREN